MMKTPCDVGINNCIDSSLLRIYQRLIQKRERQKKKSMYSEQESKSLFASWTYGQHNYGLKHAKLKCIKWWLKADKTIESVWIINPMNDYL